MQNLFENGGGDWLLHFSSLFVFVTMVVGAFFFSLVRSEVVPSSRLATVVLATIFAASAVIYWFIVSHQPTTEAGGATEIRCLGRFITVPLTLAVFLLLRAPGRGASRFGKLLIPLSFLMLAVWLVGERCSDCPGLHYGCFALGLILWVTVIALLLNTMLKASQAGVGKVLEISPLLVYVVSVGWAIYPVGFLLPSFGISFEHREIAYNIFDLVNIVGFAILALAGTRQKVEE